MRKNKITYIIALMLFASTFVSNAEDVNSILAKYRQATGDSAIKASEGWRAVGTNNMHGIIENFEFFYKPDGRFKYRASVRGFAKTLMFNGTEGWHTYMHIEIDLPQHEINLYHFYISVFYGIFERESYEPEEIQLVGEETIDGNLCYKLKLNFDEFIDDYAFIDKETYLLRKFTTFAPFHETVAPIEVRIKEYRETNGMMLPRTIEFHHENILFRTLHTLNFEPNFYLIDIDFKKLN